MFRRALLAALLPLWSLGAGHAEGNLAAKPIDLPDLVLNNDLTISQTQYDLETGQSYRLNISSDGEEQFEWMSPDLFRNVWLDQVVIDDLKVKTFGIYSLEFDDAGTFTLTFVPIRTGRFDFWVDGYENRGMKGAFMVN